MKILEIIMWKKTDTQEGLPKNGMRAATLTLAAIYLILFLVMSIVKFPGGNGETILMHILQSLVR